MANIQKNEYNASKACGNTAPCRQKDDHTDRSTWSSDVELRFLVLSEARDGILIG